MSLQVFTLILLFVCFFILFHYFVAYTREKLDYRILVPTLIGWIFLACLICLIVFPGLKFSAQALGVTLSLDNTSANQHTLFALNTDKKDNVIYFSASSEQPTDVSAIKILIGKEYTKLIDKSEDNKLFLYSATLPPGQELKVATPPSVTFNTQEAFPFWKKQTGQYPSDSLHKPDSSK